MRENDGSNRWQRERMIAQSCPTCTGEDLRGLIASLRYENNSMTSLIANLAALIPLEDTPEATRTGAAMVDYFRAALAKRETV